MLIKITMNIQITIYNNNHEKINYYIYKMAIGCLIIFSLAFIIFVIDYTTLGLLTNNIACLPFDVINNHEYWRLPFSFLFNCM